MIANASPLAARVDQIVLSQPMVATVSAPLVVVDLDVVMAVMAATARVLDATVTNASALNRHGRLGGSSSIHAAKGSH